LINAGATEDTLIVLNCDDKTSRQVMVDFFGELNKGGFKRISLLQAASSDN